MVAGGGDPAVEVEAERLLRDPARRHERLHRQVDPQLPLLRHRLALQLLHRLLQDADVGVEPDGGDVAVLLGAEHVAGAPQLQVAQGDAEAAAEGLVNSRDRGEPLVRLLGELALRREEQVRERALGAAADAPAQLVELREAHQVGVGR